MTSFPKGGGSSDHDYVTYFPFLEISRKYNSMDSDGTISSTPTLIQAPDSNTNMFTQFSTSLLAMYLFLIGNI